MPSEPKTYKFFQNASPDAFEKGRALRQRTTDAEEKLWLALRNRKLGGLKFRRQHPFVEYILDFFCNELSLAVEVDGDYHLTQEQKAYDENRTGFLVDCGLTVIRFTNAQVMNELNQVLIKILNHKK
jgi:very-short-patch-repair endonuclease